MYSALLIDDEADARSALSHLINLFCPQITVLSEASDGQEAIALASKKQFDLIFVDIQLNNESGLDLVEKLYLYCQKLIFVTAHDNYAVEAFQTPVIHYLLKPIDPLLLQQAVEKAALDKPATEKTEGRIILNTKGGFVILNQAEITHVKASGNYCTFYTAKQESIFVSKHLAHYESLLDSHQFQRIHQSYLVNLTFIRQFVNEDGTYVILNTGEKLPISRRQKDSLVQALAAR